MPTIVSISCLRTITGLGVLLEFHRPAFLRIVLLSCLLLPVSGQAEDCSPAILQSATSLTLQQRTCFYGRELITPKFALRAAFAAAFGQFKNSPHVSHQDLDDFPRRIAVYYARRTARSGGELIAGYLHHEDPRFRHSTEHNFWRRADFAFLNVLTSPDVDGHLRPAYAPIAGSFSSAFVGSALYRHRETLSQTLLHAGAIYSYYFARNFFAEFKPDVNAYVRRFLHRDK